MSATEREIAKRATPADVLRWQGELHAIDVRLASLRLQHFVLGRMVVSGRGLLHDAAALEAMRSHPIEGAQ